MNQALKAYLEKSEKLELDVEAFEEHLRAMTDTVVPIIVEDIMEGERVAAELRYSPVTTSRRDG
jgi:hypothetical protein